MVVPMVALMRVRGHIWRMANEMSLGMVSPIVVCFALVRSGIDRRRINSIRSDSVNGASAGVAAACASRAFFTHFPNVISWTPIFRATSAIDRSPSMTNLTASSLYSSAQ